MRSKALKPWICVILSALLIILTVSAVSEDPGEVQNWAELAAKAHRKRDYETAFHYCKLAAEAGIMDAQRMTAGYYYYGMGTERSFERAAEYFQMAADQGDPEAQAWLGRMYHYGSGLDQDDEKAVAHDGRREGVHEILFSFLRFRHALPSFRRRLLDKC